MNTKSVLVVNPLSRDARSVVRDVVYGCWCKGKRIAGATVPPFALLQVATCIKGSGIPVTFIDAQASGTPIEEYADEICQAAGLVISTSTMSFLEDVAYIKRLKTINPGLITVVFGSHPTFRPDHTLSFPEIQIAVRHEPYFSITRFFRDSFSAASENALQTPGISYRNQEGKITHNPEIFETNLDILPIPDVSFLPKGFDYFNPVVKRTPYITTTTSWGCPGKCLFCPAPTFDGPQIRYKSADYVLRELAYYQNMGFKEVYFRDETFFILQERDSAICREMIRRQLDLTWIANARVGMINGEMMKLAMDAGCHLIKFGVESGVQSVLDRSKKGYQLNQAFDIFRVAREIGMDTHAHIMLGMPGDTRKTIQETIRFVTHDLQPTTATFGICTPYPGTPLFEEVFRKSPAIGYGTGVNLKNLHLDGTFNETFCAVSGKDLSNFVRLAYRRFYCRPSYFLKMAGKMMTVHDLKRVALAGTRILDFIFRGD